MQKKGILITNAFLRTDKFAEHYEWLQKAAKKRLAELELMDNSSQLSFCGADLSWLDSYDFVLFWDKDIGLGKEITRYAVTKNIPVFNPVDAIAACDDKFETYFRIGCYNEKHPSEAVSILPTILAPMTYENIGYTTLDFLEQIEKKLSYPMVVKECFGSFGMQVYLINDRSGLEHITKNLEGKPFLYQKYHSFSSGRDVRLQVVGDRVVAAMYRYSENGDFRANITNGGKMKNYQPTSQEEALAVRITRILGLDFAGVDLLFSENRENGANILCEVNSNAHFKNIYTCTGVNVAEYIMDYILKHL